MDEASAALLADKTIFPDFPSGPLKCYRDQSTFCYKRMTLLLESVDHIRLKVSIQHCIFAIIPKVLGKTLL